MYYLQTINMIFHTRVIISLYWYQHTWAMHTVCQQLFNNSMLLYTCVRLATSLICLSLWRCASLNSQNALTKVVGQWSFKYLSYAFSTLSTSYVWKAILFYSQCPICVPTFLSLEALLIMHLWLLFMTHLVLFSYKSAYYMASSASRQDESNSAPW